MEQLRCFVCVYETLNITGASQQLSKTQSAVTIALQKFEETIGIELFNRRAGKGLIRSDCAENIYIKAIDILKRVDSLGLTTEKTIRIGIPDDLTTLETLQIKEYFTDYYRDVTVSLIVDKNENHARSYSNGNLDFYLHKKLKVNNEKPEINNGYYLYTAKLIWVGRKCINLELLDCLSLVSFHEGCIPRVSLEQALAMLQIPYKFVYESFSWYQNIEAIKSGLGVGIILDTMCDNDLTVLGSKEGFPILGDIDIYLIGRQVSDIKKLAEGLKKYF
ncbi:transcriptional regulator LysR family [Vibrio astriarenae]|nr:transcriptional regulator LysR family [Vibrio sp. C7]